MNQWQPMSTAPKDGTKIDIWVRERGTYNWNGEPYEEFYRVADAWWETEYASGEWWGPYELHGDAGSLRAEPEFWMPVPPPPA